MITLFDEADTIPSIPLGFIGVYRWFWFLIRILAYVLYKPMKPRKHPKYYPARDVTIVIPTIDAGPGVQAAMQTWLDNNPYQIIIVTIEKVKDELLEIARQVDPMLEKVRIVTVNKPNKRNQMVAGANHVKTEITIFCDDDVLWPPTMVKYILAAFEDRRVGGVGTSQAVIPCGSRWTLWEILAAFRISMRNVEIVSTSYIDGGVCCLSGRTAAYRTRILRDPDFQWKFTHEYWLGKYHQHSGDDKFLTRWLHSHEWRTYIQACPEVELKSYFKDNWRFLKQLLRWTRNTWRSDMRSLFTERFIWTRHPFTAFTMLDKFFNMFTLLAGPITVTYLCTRVKEIPVWVVLTSYFVWLLVTRLIKYMPHFVRRPQDVIYVPLWLLFNIYFAVMKIYCLFTLHITDWGTRDGADHKTKNEDLDIYTPHWQDEEKDERVALLNARTSASVHHESLGRSHLTRQLTTNTTRSHISAVGSEFSNASQAQMYYVHQIPTHYVSQLPHNPSSIPPLPTGAFTVPPVPVVPNVDSHAVDIPQQEQPENDHTRVNSEQSPDTQV